MSIDSLGSASAYARNIRSTRIRKRKKRSGFTTAVSAAILIAAVSILGSIVVIWANTTFSAQQRQIGDYYEKNSNLLKETFIVEDVWLSKVPSNYVNVTLRNVGDIAIDIKEIKIAALNSTGTAACTLTCVGGLSTQTVPAPFPPTSSNGVISSKQTLMIAVANIDWDDDDSTSLDISVTTERGSIERIIWKVSGPWDAAD